MNHEQLERWHIKRWVLLVLSSAQREAATDLIMAPATEGGISIRYRIDGAWHDWAPTHGLAWTPVVSELGGLAGIRDAPFPKAGIIYVAYSGVRVRWQIFMTSSEAGCALHHLGGDTL